ncbi:uncharacterized protein CDAR_247021 [Caerostris darwini]|uniref:Uncharacterized protein n=1 Tax=Caerostris darwini TaxID=1538125 RepID=A0AAV4SBX4_9ARAC|nr:uncharacterized protein CDAR_247021 [Caerostris darwini]
MEPKGSPSDEEALEKLEHLKISDGSDESQRETTNKSSLSVEKGGDWRTRKSSEGWLNQKSPDTNLNREPYSRRDRTGSDTNFNREAYSRRDRTGPDTNFNREAYSRRDRTGSDSRTNAESGNWRNQRGDWRTREYSGDWLNGKSGDSRTNTRSGDWRNRESGDSRTNAASGDWRNRRYEDSRSNAGSGDWRNRECTDAYREGYSRRDRGGGDYRTNNESGSYGYQRRGDYKTNDGPSKWKNQRGLGAKETENDEPRPLWGWWTVLCDPENKNSEGLTELDIASNVLKDLCDRERSLFTSPPSFKRLDIGTTSISCYTVDCADEDSILKSAEAIRECFYYPYAMYYFISRTVSQYMHTPNGEFYRKVDRSWALVSSV